MREQKNLDKKIITITCVLLVLVFALSLVTPVISKKPDKLTRELPNTAATQDANIETYLDSKCTKKVSSIDWGPVEPGTSKTFTLFIRNKGKNPVTLSYYTSNWSPSQIVDSLALIWDYNGQPIGFRETIQVVFILQASEDAEPIETFSFDTVIVDTQQTPQ